MGDFTWDLLTYMKEDVRDLLRAFQNTGSLRFSDFSKVWREAQFSLIFRKRNSYAELLEFCEEILHITKQFLLPAHEFHVRVGALYTLYGLYFKQPLKEPAKIRLIRSEWENLSDVIDQCKRENHIDAVFIHLKLFYHQAYLFTATERTMGLELGYRKYYNQRSIAISEKLDDPDENPIIEPGLLDELSKMVSLYSKTKSIANGGKNDPKLVDVKFAEYLRERCKINKNEKPMVREGGNDDEIDDDGDDEDWRPDLEEERQSSIGARRTKLKEKGFTSENKKTDESKSMATTVNETPLVKKPKILKNLLMAKKKAQILIRQKELNLNVDPQPGQSSAPDLVESESASESFKDQEDNFTLPQL